jgi:hypothetical protein
MPTPPEPVKIFFTNVIFVHTRWSPVMNFPFPLEREWLRKKTEKKRASLKKGVSVKFSVAFLVFLLQRLRI